ncbi:MAG: 3-deoxy-7-phosphoheptulonate synthase [Chloroflexi bacterium]|nr:3-deoxy-7-phosphoheptulonate synthase [Chloroflexota bacterium]MBI3732633.1 3-deoxy-7-phosphoheptulonate synthase [Chloroflexota bacterium]
MVIVMKHGATSQQIGEAIQRIEALGYQAHVVRGVERTIIGAVGNGRTFTPDIADGWDGVEQVVRILKPFKLASRDFQQEDTVIALNGSRIGSDQLVVMAGPCSVEDRCQIMETAQAVKEAGAKVLRGGAFKPRSSPYSFQGMGEAGLELLHEAGQETGLLTVTEVMSVEQMPLVARHADILQIGARNMQNYPLLHAAGESQHPVLLKRGMSATLEELLMAAEYILSHGNRRVMVCERGIRTFETYTRNTFDLNAIPALQEQSHLPVIADPSHGTGKAALVGAVAKGAVAAGASGLLIEVHPNPAKAVSDGAQSLTLEAFSKLMGELKGIAVAVGKRL